MKTLTLLIFTFFFAIVGMGQEHFTINDASKNFNVEIVVNKCDGWSCGGPTTYRLYRKGSRKSIRIFHFPETLFFIGETQETQSKVREAVYFDDFNFDGKEDVAICDGRHASYFFPSYRVYLSSNGRFVYNSYFSRLTRANLGMFHVDKKKKQLETINKSGCCYHVTARYAVERNRPKKVFELIEDGTNTTSDKMEITTRKLIQGRWRTWVRSK